MVHIHLVLWSLIYKIIVIEVNKILQIFYKIPKITPNIYPVLLRMRIHPFHLKLYHHHQNNLLLDAICLCDCSVFIIPPELGVVATSFRTDQSETHPSFNTITVMLISFGTSEDDFAAAAASFHRLLSSTVNALTHTHTHTHTRITACICQWLHYMSTERRERLGVCQHPTQVICDSFHTHARKHAHTRTHTHKHTLTTFC